MTLEEIIEAFDAFLMNTLDSRKRGRAEDALRELRLMAAGQEHSAEVSKLIKEIRENEK